VLGELLAKNFGAKLEDYREYYADCFALAVKQQTGFVVLVGEKVIGVFLGFKMDQPLVSRPPPLKLLDDINKSLFKHIFKLPKSLLSTSAIVMGASIHPDLAEINFLSDFGINAFSVLEKQGIKRIYTACIRQSMYKTLCSTGMRSIREIKLCGLKSLE
jgi:hypothetical protein